MRPEALSSWMRPVGVTRKCCAPGQIYSVPGCTASLASASLTRMLVNSASCAAYCVVKVAGKAGTKTHYGCGPAGGRGQDDDRESLIGGDDRCATLCRSRRRSGSAFHSLERGGQERGGAHDTNLGGHAHFAHQIFLHGLHVEVDAAGRLADELDGAEFKRFQGTGGAIF